MRKTPRLRWSKQRGSQYWSIFIDAEGLQCVWLDKSRKPNAFKFSGVGPMAVLKAADAKAALVEAEQHIAEHCAIMRNHYQSIIDMLEGKKP